MRTSSSTSDAYGTARRSSQPWAPLVRRAKLASGGGAGAAAAGAEGDAGHVAELGRGACLGGAGAAGAAAVRDLEVAGAGEGACEDAHRGAVDDGDGVGAVADDVVLDREVAGGAGEGAERGDRTLELAVAERRVAERHDGEAAVRREGVERRLGRGGGGCGAEHAGGQQQTREHASGRRGKAAAAAFRLLGHDSSPVSGHAERALECEDVAQSARAVPRRRPPDAGGEELAHALGPPARHLPSI